MSGQVAGPRCALYLRTEALGPYTAADLEVQRLACEAFISARAPEGWTLVAAFEDAGYPGDGPARPGFVELLGAVRQWTLDVVVVHQPDRLWEPYVGYLDLQAAFVRRGLQLVSVLPPSPAPILPLHPKARP